MGCDAAPTGCRGIRCNEVNAVYRCSRTQAVRTQCVGACRAHYDGASKRPRIERSAVASMQTYPGNERHTLLIHAALDENGLATRSRCTDRCTDRAEGSLRSAWVEVGARGRYEQLVGKHAVYTVAVRVQAHRVNRVRVHCACIGCLSIDDVTTVTVGGSPGVRGISVTRRIRRGCVGIAARFRTVGRHIVGSTAARCQHRASGHERDENEIPHDLLSSARIGMPCAGLRRDGTKRLRPIVPTSTRAACVPRIRRAASAPAR